MNLERHLGWAVPGTKVGYVKCAEPVQVGKKVQCSLKYSGGTWYGWMPTQDLPVAVVGCTQPVGVSVLESVKTRQIEMRLKAGPVWQRTDCIFTMDNGSPIDPDNLSQDTCRSGQTESAKRHVWCLRIDILDDAATAIKDMEVRGAPLLRDYGIS